MGIVNKTSNLYDTKGKLITKANHYRKGYAPLSGNYDVMAIGMATHRRNVRKGK